MVRVLILAPASTPRFYFLELLTALTLQHAGYRCCHTRGCHLQPLALLQRNTITPKNETHTNANLKHNRDAQTQKRHTHSAASLS